MKFKIAEIFEMSPDWVFARTNSAGTRSTMRLERSAKRGNQELFIFHKEKDGKFKIARYREALPRGATDSL